MHSKRPTSILHIMKTAFRRVCFAFVMGRVNGGGDRDCNILEGIANEKDAEAPAGFPPPCAGKKVPVVPPPGPDKIKGYETAAPPPSWPISAHLTGPKIPLTMPTKTSNMHT